MADEFIPDPSPAAAQPPALPTPPPLHPRRERLPGTYAGNYLDVDPSPAAGAVVTGILFVLAFALEPMRLLTEILAGFDHEADLYTLVRVGLFSVALITFWVGAVPARWVLAGGAFLFGAGLLVQTMTLPIPVLMQAPSAILSAPLAIVYLGIFIYLGFSSNALAFVRSQRAGGKTFSVLPVVGLCGLCLLSLCSARVSILR